MNTYRTKEFAKLIAKTTNTLQRWDREGILKAHRTPANRRFYTYEQLSEILLEESQESNITQLSAQMVRF